MGLNLMNRIVARLTFRFMLLKRAYIESEFREFYSRTKFGTVEFQGSPTGFDIRFEK